jgi:hypothetical protein
VGFPSLALLRCGRGLGCCVELASGGDHAQKLDVVMPVLAEVSTDLANGRLREWSQLAAHYMYNRFVPEEFTPRGAGNQPNGGGDMRTEQKADPTQASWDNLPF